MTDTSLDRSAADTSAVDFVAIDGPAGSGKSSVSKAVARKLGFGYLDTGSAYRALAWHVLDRGADTADADAVLAAASDFPVSRSAWAGPVRPAGRCTPGAARA